MNRRQRRANAYQALTEIQQAVTGYHLALDDRENGGLACHQAMNKIQSILQCPWRQNKASEEQGRVGRRFIYANTVELS